MAVYYCSALIDQGNHNSLGKLIFSFSTKDRLEIQSVILNFCYHFCNLWNENQVQRNEVCLKQILSAIELMPSRQLDHFKVLFILSSLNKKERKKVKKRNRWWANISFIKPRTVISTSFIFQTHAGTFKASIT